MRTRDQTKQGAGGGGVLNAAELVELLRSDYSSAADGEPQSGVVDDATLARLLDRAHLLKGAALPYPASGVGYEVVAAGDGGGLLSNVE